MAGDTYVDTGDFLQIDRHHDSLQFAFDCFLHLSLLLRPTTSGNYHIAYNRCPSVTYVKLLPKQNRHHMILCCVNITQLFAYFAFIVLSIFNILLVVPIWNLTHSVRRAAHSCSAFIPLRTESRSQRLCTKQIVLFRPPDGTTA